MSSGRFLGGLLIGGALGAIIGLLVAPRSGEETREIIREELDARWNQSTEKLKKRTDALKTKATDTAEQLREKTQALATELEETGRETWGKIRSAVKTSKSTEESPN
jgi:gas vesicle protein